MIKFFIPVFLVLILFGYTNCGQISNHNKTSTQAINPGDFGGDDGNQNTIGAQALSTIGIRLCNRMVSLSTVASFESCMSNVYNDEPTSAALGSIGVGRTLDELITLASSGQLAISSTSAQICFSDIENYLRQNNPDAGAINDLIAKFLSQNSNSYNSELAVLILSSSLGCRNLFGTGTTF